MGQGFSPAFSVAARYVGRSFSGNNLLDACGLGPQDRGDSPRTVLYLPLKSAAHYRNPLEGCRSRGVRKVFSSWTSHGQQAATTRTRQGRALGWRIPLRAATAMSSHARLRARLRCHSFSRSSISAFGTENTLPARLENRAFAVRVSSSGGLGGSGKRRCLAITQGPGISRRIRLGSQRT